MPAYKSYPTVLTVPSRKQRKAKRKDIFEFNRLQGAIERKQRQAERKKGN